MHENLLRVYLPNATGLASGSVLVVASEIFGERSATRARVRAFLAALPTSDARESLMAGRAGSLGQMNGHPCSMKSTPVIPAASIASFTRL